MDYLNMLHQDILKLRKWHMIDKGEHPKKLKIGEYEYGRLECSDMFLSAQSDLEAPKYMGMDIEIVYEEPHYIWVE